MNNFSHFSESLQEQMRAFFIEDGLNSNDYYFLKLPYDPVVCSLKFKSDALVAGLPYFFEVFRFLGKKDLSWENFQGWEGLKVQKEGGESLQFSLPFSMAITGERLALNLLQRASAVATYTRKFVEKAEKYQIAILDTRKTTPGLKLLEKYAVRVGGGANHRVHQTDSFMIKDNHKKFFGNLTKAVEFFRSLKAFYHPLVVEIHNLEELKEAMGLKIYHVMLDNFTPEQVKRAIDLKCAGMTLEVSGGINLENIENYLIEGLDAISIGGLTHNPPPVDFSLKISPP